MVIGGAISPGCQNCHNNCVPRGNCVSFAANWSSLSAPYCNTENVGRSSGNQEVPINVGLVFHSLIQLSICWRCLLVQTSFSRRASLSGRQIQFVPRPIA